MLPSFAPTFTEAVVSGAGATSIPLDVPPGTNDGELLFAHTAWRGDGLHEQLSWTERQELSQASGPSAAMFTRVAASEPASYTFGFSGAASRVLAFGARLVNAAAVEDSAEASGGGVAGTNFVAPSLTSLGPERLLICLFVSTHTDTFTTPASMDVFDSNNSGGSLAGIVRYNLCTEAVGEGATGTRTATIAVARLWIAMSMLISPSHPGPRRSRRSGYMVSRRRRGM